MIKKKRMRQPYLAASSSEQKHRQWLVSNLQSKLNFTWEVSLATYASTTGRGTLEDITVLVSTLVEAKERAVEDIQEISPEFNIHPLRNRSPFDDGEVFAVSRESANGPIRPRSITEGKILRLQTGRERTRTGAGVWHEDPVHDRSCR